MPNSTLGPVQIFSLDMCSINLALMEIQNRLDESKGLRGEAIVNDRVRLHNTPVQDLNVEPDIVTNVYAETPRGVPPLQQVEALLGEGLFGLRPLVAPPSVGNMSLIGSDLTRYASEGHTHEGVNLADIQTITGVKTLGAATVATGKLLFAGVTSGVVTVQVADVAGTWSLTLPTTDGNSGEALLTDGNGVTSWGVPGGIVPTTRTLTITGTANQVTVTPNTAQDLSVDRSWAIALTGPYTPATYTAHGVLVGEGTSSIVALTVGTNGQVLLGSTGADPVFATLGAGTGISYTPGAGSLTITNTGATSVSNSDGSLTISPTAGAVIASLNVAHSNTFTALQDITIAGVGPALTLHVADSATTTGAGATFTMFNTDTTNNNRSAFSMSFVNSGGVTSEAMTRLSAQRTDNTIGAQSGHLDLATRRSGTIAIRATVKDGLQIYNAGTAPTGDDKGAGTLNTAVAHYLNGQAMALFPTGSEMAFGDASQTTRLRTSAATPGSLADGDWWVDCTGTSPTRVCAIKVRDGGATRTIASVTY